MSEASYLYILSGQKFTKNAKNGSFHHKNWWQMVILKNSNESFWFIFKHCDNVFLIDISQDTEEEGAKRVTYVGRSYM